MSHTTLIALYIASGMCQLAALVGGTVDRGVGTAIGPELRLETNRW